MFGTATERYADAMAELLDEIVDEFSEVDLTKHDLAVLEVKYIIRAQEILKKIDEH